MKKYLFFSLLTSFFLTSIRAQEKSADAILNEAYKTAAKEHKKVFIIFHASWCVWCRKMDSSMNDQSCKDFFNKNYVIRHLTILESADKKDLENPGAMQLYTKYTAGKQEGIPFWLILDKDGNLLADSQISPGVNTGCPAKEEEVAHFIEMLKKTSPVTKDQIAAIEQRFRRND